jgi:membrane-bound lytic murein transglycosylase B
LTTVFVPSLRRAVTRATTATLVVALAAVCVTSPASAQTPPPSAPTAPPPPIIIDRGGDTPSIEDPRLSPRLAGVAVTGAGVAPALATYRATQARLRAATAARTGAEALLEDLRAAQSRLVGTLNEALRRQEKSARELDALRASLQALAVHDYVSASQGVLYDIGLDPQASTNNRATALTTTIVRADQLNAERRHATAYDAATATITSSQAELDEVRRRIVETTGVRDQATTDERDATATLVRDTQAVADARITSPVEGLDFTLVALDAYVKAADALAALQPSCGLRWQLLAGVGRTESFHGTFGGAALDGNGNESKPIVGIPLDGSNGTAFIGDTDGGALDGDTAVDRAVGPFQFIPGTWSKFARDGNGDGVIDPQNYYDGSLAAATYLCRQGPGLDGDEGMLRALRSYNNSTEYGVLVLERTKGYDTFTVPAPPPR